MIIRDSKGNERIAMAYDFQDTTITFTPSEWTELCNVFSFQCRKIKPDVFSKLTREIMMKLEANPPKLKAGYEKVQNGWTTISSEQEIK